MTISFLLAVILWKFLGTSPSYKNICIWFYLWNLEILCEFSCRFTQDFENVINLSMISLSDVPITPPKDLPYKSCTSWNFTRNTYWETFSKKIFKKTKTPWFSGIILLSLLKISHFIAIMSKWLDNLSRKCKKGDDSIIEFLYQFTIQYQR